MIDLIFSPSFGNRPKTLVGRSAVIQQFLSCLQSPKGSRERAVLLLGQRGSGKTVLLLELADLANKNGYITASPTVNTHGMLQRIIEKLYDSGKDYLSGDRPKITGGSIGALGFNAGIQFQEQNDPPLSFSAQLTALCKKINTQSKGVLILVDEVQANNSELRHLIIAYQEMVGAGYNISLVLAGLPGAISATLNDHVLTFLNRATKISLSDLPATEIEVYYRHSFNKLQINLSSDDCHAAAEAANGSPYMMQLIGHYITVFANEDGSISSSELTKALENAKKDFINDICITSLNSLSNADIAFLKAMSGDLKSSLTSQIAERLNKSSAYVQNYKRRLIDAGIIKQVRRGEVAFALPYLQSYLCQLDDEN